MYRINEKGGYYEKVIFIINCSIIVPKFIKVDFGDSFGGSMVGSTFGSMSVLLLQTKAAEVATMIL